MVTSNQLKSVLAKKGVYTGIQALLSVEKAQKKMHSIRNQVCSRMVSLMQKLVKAIEIV